MGFFQKLRRKVTGAGAPPVSLAATGDITNTSNIVKNISISTSTIFAGCTITGTGIPAATTVLRILDASTIEMSANATATTAALAITFGELFKYGSVATDGSSLYYATQTHTVNRAVAASGALAESIDGTKTFTTNVKSGTVTLNDTPPLVNNDLTRKDYVDQRSVTARRQTVISGRSGSVHADFIEAGTGLSATATADGSNPIITSVANGFNANDGLPIDLMNRTTADVSYTGLTANATNFLGLERISQTQVDPIKSVLAPQYGQFFSSDRENKINASFDGTHGDTEFVDEYGNFFRCYGSGWQISNVNQYSGMNTLRCNGVDNVSSTNRCEVTLANFDDRSLDQWTYEGFFRADAVATANYQPIFYTIPGTNLAGMGFHLHPTDGSIYFDLSNNESTFSAWLNTPAIGMNAVASRTGFGTISTGGAGTPLQAAQWYHFAWVFNGVQHKFFLNGYLLRTWTSTVNDSDVFTYLKPSKAQKIYLGSYTPSDLAQKLTGNIAHFAFHPYAKYQTKKYTLNASDTPAFRDIFTPPSVPLSLTVQEDRYFQSAEAIYLDFEQAADQDIITKDLYGRQLSCFGNDSATLTSASYIESGAAKYGTKSLYFSGSASQYNAAYIKAPVWADKWTVEFWGMDNLLTAPNKNYLNQVVPPVSGFGGFAVYSDGNGSNIRYSFQLGTNDATADIINFNTAYSYNSATYAHLAVSYDGVTYRCFVNGVLATSVVSQLKILQGAYFIFGRSANNTNHLDGKIDDFAYVPYCKYTAGFTPPATALLASMPEQYVFDTKKMQMYKGYPTAFVAENTVFVGEALTSAVNVEQVITYALNGEYEERFSSDFLGNMGAYIITKRHNLGVGSTRFKLYIVGISGSTNNLLAGELMEVLGAYYNGAYITPLPPMSIRNRNLFSMHPRLYSGDSPSFLFADSGGSYIVVRASSAHYIDFVAKVERSF